MRAVFGCVAIVLSACAGQPQPALYYPPPPTLVWVKDGASSQEFYRTSTNCQERMYALPNAAAVTQIIFYQSCMGGDGWRQEPKRP